MNLIRKIKINKFIPCLTKQEQDIISFIENKLLNLIKYKYYCDMFQEHEIYFGNIDNECIFRINITNHIIWIKYDNFWNILGIKYKLDYSVILSILEYYIKKFYKKKNGNEPDISDFQIISSHLNFIPEYVYK